MGFQPDFLANRLRACIGGVSALVTMTPMMRWMPMLAAVLLSASLLRGQTSASVPFDVSGTYQFLQDGESLQINIQGEALSGYINAHGSGDTDRELILAFFLTTADWDGQKIRFKTKVVHGVSYVFEGHIERGPAKDPADEGYLLMVGTLTQTSTDDRYRPTTHPREIALRSAREGLSGDWAQGAKQQ
jgi:hypothetical protein